MIRENVFKIKRHVSLVCSKINRDPNYIIIVAVSKGRTVEQIKEVIAAGITDIGENRVQEAILKYNALRTTPYAQRIKWHMIGHLQRNKVKDAVGIFDLVQSVDSLYLAQEIDKQAAKINKVQDILIQVNTSGEATKFGIKPDEAIQVIKNIVNLKHINIKGLMTIAPLLDEQEKTRPYFKKLRELIEEINTRRITHDAIRILSMGMTDDFAAAIKEGSNMVRLGRAIFEG